MLAVYDGNDRLVWRFEYADQRMPIAMSDASGTKYYLHYDQVGSLRAVSDANGNVVKAIVYDTFGNILSDTNPSFKVPFGFAGGLYDPLTKLTHFGYREYDSFTGKWTARGPIGFAGGDSNLYGYVLNDPVNLVDPWGLDALNDLSNFFAGFGDAITFGLTEEFRKTYGYDSAVNKCSKAYNYGDWTSLGLGGLRLGYAGAAKGISWAASSVVGKQQMQEIC